MQLFFLKQSIFITVLFLRLEKKLASAIEIIWDITIMYCESYWHSIIMMYFMVCSSLLTKYRASYICIVAKVPRYTDI